MAERVDLDLDAFAPPETTIRFRGQVYRLPGAIPVPTITRSVVLKAALREAEISGDDDQAVESMNQLYEMVMELIRDCQPDAPDIRFSPDDLMLIFGFIAGGDPGQPLEEAILETIGGKDETAEERSEDEGVPPTSPPGEAPAARATSRSRSPKRSPVPSSS